MSVSGQRICRLAEEAADAAHPESALRALIELRAELEQFERQQVARALTAGRSFSAIARALGVSRQAANRRFRDLTQSRQASEIPPSPEVRLAVEYAGLEAAASGAGGLQPAHVLIGILRTGDRHGAAALTSAGVDLEECRRAAPSGGGDELGVRALLAEAVQNARRAGRDRVDIEDALRAVLSGAHPSVDAMLQGAGVAPERVLEALAAMPAEDAADSDA